MQSGVIMGLAGALAALPAVADSAPRYGAAPSAMQVGQAGPATPMRAPQYGPQPGGWTQGGWSGGTHGGNAGYPGGGYHRHQWGNWSGGGAYHRPYRGGRLGRFYIAPSFYLSDWGAYGLGAPGYGQGWYRYYDDAVLAGNDGMIYDTRGGIDWDRFDEGPGYGDREDGPPPPPPPHRWRDDEVTWGTTRPFVYHSPPGSTTTVIIQSAPTITTHTYVEERVVTHRVWRAAPKRKWHPRWRPAPCSCACACR